MADVNVNLSFTADASKAKASLQDLQNSLKNLTSNSNIKTQQLGLTKDITSAVSKVRELQAALQSATNVNTGKLDLGQFNQHLQQGKTSLSQYAQALKSLGPEGQQAFSKLTTSILQAEVPMKRASKVLNDLKTTMMNTMKWQLSSSVLHGFIRSVSSAYGYAKDLNESLNNIRIVTGYNVDKMSQFASEANKAAKALSTTTTAYTDASLIYYQQGLGDQEVKERTDVTIKLANVSRQSAEEVSSQMTAIWNNFDDGTKSLEYYADAITALGAKTASSSAEIAEGLQKFAAVSDTVGLSYEYATAALATVVAQTRQSADTVGTAFKTLFARIEGLKLGETLEDGTTFNQYSQALATIGVNIKDTNGELKNMDIILDEMGAKWKELNRDEQVAVAQKVAGVRQYQQMIALMDNYDIFKENVNVAADSSGTLQDQADIYAESWEAARKRVQASVQSIYQALLNDKFFIEANNNFAKFLDGINNIITGLGGLKGVLSLIGGILFRVFGNDLSKMMSTFAYNIKMNSSIGRKEIMDLRQEAIAANKAISSESVFSNNLRNQVFETQANAQEKILAKTEQLKAQGFELANNEQRKLSYMVQELELEGNIAIKKEEEINASKSILDAETNNLTILIQRSKQNDYIKNSLLQELNGRKQLIASYQSLTSYMSKYESFMKSSGTSSTQGFESAKNSLMNLKTLLEQNGLLTDKFKTILSGLDSVSPQQLREIMTKINTELTRIGPSAMNGLGAFKDRLGELGIEGKVVDQVIDKLEDNLKILGDSSATAADKASALKRIETEIAKALEEANRKTYTAADGLVALGSQLMSISMLINSLKGLNDIWNDDSTSYWEKLLSTFTSLGMILPMVINSFSALNIQKVKDGALDAARIIKKGLLNALYKEEIVKKWTEGAVTEAVNKINLKEISIKERLLALDWKRIAIFLVLAAIIGTLIAIGKKWYDQQHAAEIQAQKATEAADKQREAYNKMKEEQQNLSNTATSYQEVVDKIHNMTAGTIEYTESLVEANEKALELIETFNGLNYTVENGLIKIDKDSLNEALLQQIEYTQNSALAMGLANAYAIEKANVVKEEDVIDQIKDAIVSSVDSVQIAEDILENAQKDNKSFFNGLIGAFSGNLDEGTLNTDSAAIGVAIASSAAESEVEKKYDFNQIVSLITNELRNGNNQIIANANNLTDFLTGAGIEDVNDGLINALLDNTSELYALGIDINALQASLDATIKSDISNRFKDYKTKKGINGIQLGEAFDIFASRMVSNEMANNPITDYNTALKIYSEKMGYNFSSATYDSQDKEGTTTFYNALGEKIADIPNQTMLLFSSHENAVDTFSKNDQEDLLKQINEWSKTLTSEKFDALLSFADGRGGDLGSFTANEVQGFSLSDFGITKDNAHFLGYSYEELDQFLTQAQNRILATYSDIEEIGKEKLGKLPVDVAIKIDTYAKKFKNAVNGVGINQDNNYLKAINEALDFYNKLSDKDKTLFLEIDLDLNKSQQNMAAALAILKNQAEAEEIKVGLHMVQQAQGALSTDMSADDYQIIKNNIEWDENSTLSYSDFIQSTYTEQVQYLQDLENQYRDSFINSNQDIIDAAQIRIQQYIDMGESYDELINKQKQLTEAGQDTTEVDNKINYLLELQSQIDDSRAEIAVAQRQEMSDYNLNVEEVENYAHYIQEAAGKSKLLSKALKNNEVAAKEVAIAVTRMNRGIDTLAKNQENWISILKKSDKSSAEYAEAMNGMKESLADILNVEKDTISSDFVQKHLKEIQQASNGSEKAIDSLGAALSHDIVANILVNSDLDEDKVQEFLSQWDNLTSQLQDIDVGVTLSGDDELVQKLNQIIKDSGMTAEQANKALKAIGFTTKFKEEPTEIVNKVPVYTTHHTVTITGSKDVGTPDEPKKALEYDETSYTIQTGEKKVPAKFTKYAMTTDGSTPQIESLTRTSDGGLNNYSGNNTGGKTSCFIAGTLISLGKIFKNIEDIQIGDIVLSYNEQTHKNEYSKVLQTMVHYVNEKIYDLYIENEILSVTGIHRFFIKQNDLVQWIATENLQINDNVLFADGTWHKIKNIKVSIQLTTVYNFEVANNHNYYVGKNQILAHNKGGGGGGSKSNPAEKKSLTKKSDIVSRYKQIEDKLKVVNRNMEKYNTLSDLAYGKEKLKNIDKVIQAYDRQIELQKELIREAQHYATIDKQSLNAAARELNVKLKYDSAGNVSNIEAAQEAIWKQLNALETAYNNQTTKEAQDEYSKKHLDPFNEKKEEFDKALALYEESLEKAAEAAQEKLNLEIERMNQKMLKKTYKLRLRIDFRLEEISDFRKELEKLENVTDSLTSRFLLLNAQLKAVQNATSSAKKEARQILKSGIYRKTEDGSIQTLEEYYQAEGLKKAQEESDKAKKKTGKGWSKEKIKKMGKKYGDAMLSNSITDILEGNVSDDFWDTWSASEEAIDTLKDLKGNAEELLDALKEIKDTVDAELPNAFAKWQEQVDKHNDTMDRLLNRYQTWMDIIELFGAKKLGLDLNARQQLDQNNVDMAIEAVVQAQSNAKTADYMASQMRSTFKVQSKYMQSGAEKAAQAVIDAQIKENENAINGTALGTVMNAKDIVKTLNKKQKDGGKLTTEEKLQLEESQKIISNWKKNNGKNVSDPESLKAAINNSNDNKWGYDYGYNAEDRQKRNEEINRLKGRLKEDISDKKRADINDRLKYLYQEKLWDTELYEYNKVSKEINTNLEAAEQEAEIVQQEMLEGINEIEEAVEEAELAAEEAQDNVLEKLLAALEAIKTAAENAFTYIREEFEKSISGGYDSVADMQDAMDKNKKRSERYLADYEKVYELTKLNRDLEKKMDETTNLKAKEKLAAFQQKIVDAQDKGLKMSKYDLEYMQKQYDLEVAKIALEEAQNAKTQVRLTRDAEGNYSYTYTADESKMAEAQQTYEDKLNDIIKLSNDYQQQMLESELNAKDEMLNALQELHQAYLDGAYTKEEYDKKKAELEAWYTEELMYYSDQRDQAARNNTLVLMSEYDKYYGTTDNKIKIERQFTDEQIANYEDLKKTYDSASETLRITMEKDLEQYKNGELTTEEYLKQLGKVRDQYNTEVKIASESMQGFMAELEGATSGVIINATDNFLPAYSNVWTSASEMNDTYLDSFYNPNNPEDTNTFIGKLNEADVTLEENIRRALAAAGIEIKEGESPWQALGREVTKQTGQMAKDASTLTQTVVTENATARTEFANSVEMVKSWYKETYPLIVKQQTALQGVIDKINGVIAAAAGLQKTPIVPKVDITDASDKIDKLQKKLDKLNKDTGDSGGNKGNTGGNTEGNGEKGTQGDKILQVGDKVTLLEKGYEDSFGGGKRILGDYVGKKVVIDSKSSTKVSGGKWTGAVGDAYIHVSTTSGGDLGWVKKSQISGYDTGGYTGKWGVDGRWALLHQKELVLNAQDTENMLAAVKTVREIATMVDLQAQNAGLASQYALAIRQLSGVRTAQQLDQNVHITAEFPNVQDHNEVELALTSLVNRASQFAWRN